MTTSIAINGRIYKLKPATNPKLTCAQCDLEMQCPPEHNICEAFRRINPNWYHCHFKRT